MNSTRHTDCVIDLWTAELFAVLQKVPHATKIETINQVTKFKKMQQSCMTSLTNGCKLTETRLASIHQKVSDWYTMSKRIYKVIVNGQTRLIRAPNPAAARSFAAKSTIQVSVASGEELYKLGQDGVGIEEITDSGDTAEGAGS